MNGATRVAILSDQSLLAAGIASRLRGYLQLVELEVVDPRQPDAMAQIAATQPPTVILDVTDPGLTQFCYLSELLLSLPRIKIIFLDPSRNTSG